MKKIAKYLPLALASVFLILPLVAFGQNQVEEGLQNSTLKSLFGTGRLSSSQNLPDLIVNVIEILLIVAGGIAVLFIIIGGYWYITSAGNEETAEKGRKTLINAIIGIIIIILAYVIINVVVNTVGNSLI